MLAARTKNLIGSLLRPTSSAYLAVRLRRPASAVSGQFTGGRLDSNASLAASPYPIAAEEPTNATTAERDADAEKNRVKKEAPFREIRAKVCEIIGEEPEWEKVKFLLSRLNSLSPHQNYLLEPPFVRKLLRSKPFLDRREELPIRYFLWMSEQTSFSPNRRDSTALFRAFVDARAWNAATSVIRSTECDLDSSLIEPFLRELLKHHAYDELVQLISVANDKFGIVPSVPTWNEAISGALLAGKMRYLWVIYKLMIGYGVCGDAFTIECLVEAFCKEKKLLQGYRFVRQVSRAGVVPNVKTFNKLVSEFCNEGNLKRGSEILHLMILVNQPPNLFTYQCIVSELCRSGRIHEAFRIFNNLKKKGYAPEVVMYNTIISGFCKARRMEDVLKLWEEMIRVGIQPDCYTYATIVRGYFKAGDLCEGQNLYNEMIKKGCKENTVTCNTLIAGFCHNGKTSEALEVFEEMPRKCIQRDAITYNTLIQGFCSEGKTVEARDVFGKLLESGLTPTERSYHHLICRLSKDGNVREAVELFGDLESRGLKASSALHESVISGFCDVDDVDQGMAWFLKMLDNNLCPGQVTFNKFISYLSLANRVDDVFLVLSIMLQFGCSLRRWTCSSLIHRLCGKKCKLAGDHLAEIIKVA